MALEEYRKELHQRVDQFAERHRTGAEADPENWPMHMEPGEWEEKFLADEYGMEG